MRARNIIVAIVLAFSSVLGPLVTRTAFASPSDAYDTVVLADGPALYWKTESATCTATSEANYGAWGTATTSSGQLSCEGMTASAGQMNGYGNSWRTSGTMTGQHDAEILQVSSNLGSGSQTYEVWFKIDPADTNTFTVMMQPDGGSTWGLLVFGTIGSGLSYGIVTGGVNRGFTGSHAVTAGVWHHMVFTYNTVGPVATGYLDGAVDGSAAQSGTLRIGNQAMRFGTRFVDGYATTLEGWISHPAVYGGALSAARVLAHYNVGSVGPGQDVTVSGNVCAQANITQSSCSHSDPAVPLVGVTVSIKNGDGSNLATPITDSAGHYTATAHFVFGDTVTVAPASYGPNPPGFVDTNLNWHPASYVIAVPSSGPLPNETGLDLQYVVPESTNADWWNINGIQVPWFTAGFTATSAQLAQLGLAKQLPTIAPKIAIGALGVVSGAVIGAAGLFLMNVTVLDPAEYTDPVTIVYSTSGQAPSTATGSQSVTLNPGQETTIVVGPGGLTSTSGTAVITNTQPAPGTTVTTTVDAPEIGPAPITTTAPTTVASGQTETNTINCGVLDLQGCLEAVFEPTTTPADLLTTLQSKLYTKVGFADVGYIQTWLASWNPTFSCWTFTVPITYFTSAGVVNRTDDSTTTLCADNPIVAWVRQFITVGLILFMLVSVIAVVKALIGFRSGVDPQMDGES